jgi:hypothetical protein
MTTPTPPTIIQRPGFGQQLQQDLGPLLQAMEQLRQQKIQAQQLQQSTEAHKIRMELYKAQLEAAKAGTEGQKMFGELAGLMLEPATTEGAAPAKPQAQRPTAREAVGTVARKAPRMLGQALTVFPKLEELVTATERQEAADRLYETTLTGIRKTDPLLARVLSTGNALMMAGVDPAFVRQLTGDMIEQGRTKRTDLSLKKLRADPAYAIAADLPDNDFLMVVREIKKEELRLALGLGPERMPKTKEEFILQHLPKLSFPANTMFGPVAPLMSDPRQARDYLGGLWDRVHESPLRIQVRSHRIPLTDTIEEGIARSITQNIDASPTVEEIKAYIASALAPSGEVDPKAVERILLRVGALSQARQ